MGYMAKRIQMNKNRFLALQKMAEQKKNEAMNANNAMNDGGIPKQTVNIDVNVRVITHCDLPLSLSSP